MLNFTEPGEVVCDPFMGIGGSALSALAHNRKVVGSELDETTHQFLMARLSEGFAPPAPTPTPNAETVFDIFDIEAIPGS